MTKTFLLEVSNDNEFLELLEGDVVLVSTVEQPRSNGKVLALLVCEDCWKGD